MRRGTTLITGVLVGAGLMLLFDPDKGVRRRALVRDKLGHYARTAPRRLRRFGRRVTGPAQGAMHELATHAPGYASPVPPDDDTFIKQRVQSALGHDTDLALDGVIFDAVDGVVRVRGTVPDESHAARLLERVAAVEGVRVAVSLLQTPDGAPVDCVRGDIEVLKTPRAAVYGAAVRRSLIERWPGLTDDAILTSDGHIERLVEQIGAHSGEPEAQIRTALDAILLAAT